MSKTKRLLILGGFLLCTLCTLCAKAVDLKITNKYEKKVTVKYFLVGYGGYAPGGWEEIDLKKNATTTLNNLGTGSGQISDVEFLAKGFHIPTSYTIGALFGKKWGGRRVIDVNALLNIKNKKGKKPKLIEIQLDPKEKKKYKVVKIKY